MPQKNVENATHSHALYSGWLKSDWLFAKRSWKWIKERTTKKRLISVLAGLAVGLYLFVQLRRNIVILDPVIVPKVLSDSGLTSEVIAQRVKDRLSSLRETNDQSQAFDPSDSSLFPDRSVIDISSASEERAPEIEIFHKISLQTALDEARKWFRKQPRHIAGEITSTSGQGQVVLWLNTAGRAPESVQHAVTLDKVDDLVDVIAKGTFELLDPFDLGVAMVDRHDLEEAKAISDRMLHRTNDEGHLYAKAHALKSYIDGLEGNYDDAEKEAAISQRLAPDAGFPHTVRAANSASQKNFDLAIREIREALKLEPKSLGNHLTLSTLLVAQSEKNLPEAEIECKTALKYAVNDSMRAYVYNNLGNIYRHEGKFSKAEQTYRLGISLAPRQANLHDNLSLSLQRSGKLAEAMEESQRAIDLRPSYAIYHNSRGTMFVNMQNYPAAVQEYCRAIELDEKYPEPHVNLGNQLARYKYWQRATLEYETAIRLGIRDPKSIEDRLEAVRAAREMIEPQHIGTLYLPGNDCDIKH